MPSTWSVLIADDEPAARRGVRQLLTPYHEFRVAGECRDGHDVLASLEAHAPDVIFLDVQMPGLSGFDVIRRRTPERMPAVVFLTAYEQFAIPAFEVEALDYLVKPVSEARFAATMKRLSRHLRAGMPAAHEPAIIVATARGTIVLALAEIDWIEAADNYARIWSGGRSHLIRESLDQFETRACAHGFVRAHRRALVRIASVRELRWLKAGGLVAVLASGATVEISRRRRRAFAAALRARKRVIGGRTAHDSP